MHVLARCVAGLLLLLGTTVSLAGENALIGRWEARDPEGSGETMTFTFSATHIDMSGERPVPYRAEREGNTVTLFVEGQAAAPPGVVTFVTENEIRMQFPGGPVIPMTRIISTDTAAHAAAGVSTDAASKPGSLMDEITAAMLPNGVPTKFEPLGMSLDKLLDNGWKLQQVSVGQGGFTVWLNNGGANALCMVVVRPFDEEGSALSDCRRLN